MLRTIRILCAFVLLFVLLSAAWPVAAVEAAKIKIGVLKFGTVNWERPTTVLFVTHDLREAILLADRIVFLSAPPGSVIDDVAVDLSRPRREDEAVVEAFRKGILRRNKALLSEPA